MMKLMKNRGFLALVICVGMQAFGPSVGYAGGAASDGVTASPDTPQVATEDLRTQAVSALQGLSEVGTAALAECIIDYFDRHMYGFRLEEKLRYFVWVGQNGWPGTGAQRSALSAEADVTRTGQTEAEFHFEVAMEICE